MKTSSIRNMALIIVVLGMTLPALAQQGTGVPAADPSQAYSVTGTVVSLSAAAGGGSPVFVVDDASLGQVEIGLAPIWYLQQEGFAATVGDQVDVLVYPCATCSVPQVAAWINNFATSVSITLRDEAGYPLWIGGGGNGGNGSNGGGNGNGGTSSLGDLMAGWASIDMASATTVTGTVISVTAEIGVSYPTLVLASGSEDLTIYISPFRLVTASGLLIAPGMELTITFAPAETTTGTVLLAISITDPITGIVIQLRDPETGFPITGGGNASARRMGSFNS